MVGRRGKNDEGKKRPRHTIVSHLSDKSEANCWTKNGVRAVGGAVGLLRRIFPWRGIDFSFVLVEKRGAYWLWLVLVKCGDTARSWDHQWFVNSSGLRLSRMCNNGPFCLQHFTTAVNISVMKLKLSFDFCFRNHYAEAMIIPPMIEAFKILTILFYAII